MSDAVFVSFDAPPTTEQMAEWRQQSEALRSMRIGQPTTASRPQAHHDFTAWKHQVDIHNGQEVRNTYTEKWGPDREVRTAFPLPPGHVRIGGMETTIEAAKVAGLLPACYKEGDPLPFDAPAGGLDETRKAGTDKEAGDKEDEVESLTPCEQRWKAEVEEASRILHGVTQLHGLATTDEHIAKAAETGEIDTASLPEGVSPELAGVVYQGYVAQADNALAPVNASVELLNEMLDEGELRRARFAVITGNTDELRTLGSDAVDRFAMLPERDPKGFLERLEGMPAAERKCLSRSKDGTGWIVTLPGRQPMSYGAAVRLGIVKTAL